MAELDSSDGDKVRWGILSTAKINRALIGPLQTSARSELLAVASRTERSARSYATRHRIPRAYGSYEALLADPQIDAVYISLPNFLHCEWCVAAAESGKHVLCEKPLVLTLEEMDRLESAAEDNGVTVFEAFMYLHHPQTLHLQEIVRSGRLGRLETLRSHFSFFLPPDDAHNIRLQTARGGGSLWDVGVYPVSFSLAMADAGAPSKVCAVRRDGETGVDVGFDGLLTFSNDVVAHVSCGFRSPLAWGATLVGSDRVLRVENPWKPGAEGEESVVHIRGDGVEEETLVFPAVDPYACEVAAMEACALDRADPVVPLGLSRQVLRTVLALHHSAASGQPVSLD